MLDATPASTNREHAFRTEYDAYPDLGLGLYYLSSGTLWGISVNAVRGPQVYAEGVPLVGRTPSEVEQWVFDRAEIREPFTELVYLPTGVPGSLSLGMMVCVQRVDDRVLTRPVFLPAEAMDDVWHKLPVEAWSVY